MSEKEFELNNPDVFAQPAEQPENDMTESPETAVQEAEESPETEAPQEQHVNFIEADGEAESDKSSESSAPAENAESAETAESAEPEEPAENAESAEAAESAESEEPELPEEIDENSREINEEQVEQLSLLDGQLPHLEAANAPDSKKAKAVLEGLLFITGDEGVTAEQAATALDITPELAAEYFDELMEEYTDDNRGIEIANYAGTYRFLSKAVVFDYAKRLFQITKTAQLSQAALETLAIIAYKQPITRVEIEEIRGVGADMMLRNLMARDLIRESGRSEAAGRPILYEVTEEFMNSFKLLSLKELPELPSFSNEEESEELFNQ